MAHTTNTVAALIDLWKATPTGRTRGANFALSQDTGIKYGTVRVMRHRESINPKHWSAIIEAARKHAESGLPGFDDVNADLLVKLATVGRPKTRASLSGSAQDLVAA